MRFSPHTQNELKNMNIKENETYGMEKLIMNARIILFASA